MEGKEKCEKNIKAGGIAALISMSVTLLFAIIGFAYRGGGGDLLSYYLDPWLLIDVVLIGFLAYFIFKKSRIASTLMVLYFIGGKLYTWLETGEFRGGLIALIFIFFFCRAMKATFDWHSKYKAPSTAQEATSEI